LVGNTSKVKEILKWTRFLNSPHERLRTDGRISVRYSFGERL